MHTIKAVIYATLHWERRRPMAFAFPTYHDADFNQPSLKNAPDARWETVEKDGVAPEEFHSTSM